MSPVLYALLILVLGSAFLFVTGRQRAMSVVGGRTEQLHSRPIYHGAFLAIVALLPAALLGLVWSFLYRPLAELYVTGTLGSAFSSLPTAEQPGFLRTAQVLASSGAAAPNDLAAKAAGLFSQFGSLSTIVIAIAAVAMAAAGLFFGFRAISAKYRARHVVERTVMAVLIAASVVAIVTTLGIVLSLIFESLRFFEKVPVLDFLFGTHWSPQSAFEGAGAEASNRNAEVFGAIPVFAGTLLITLIAMAVAAPIGLLAAIYLSDYATPKVRSVVKPLLEVLAGIPTVVYGFFAALTVAPLFRQTGDMVGIGISSESALAAGLVMGVMIIPFVSSLSDDVINAVPQSLRDGSAGLGATKSETIMKVVIPAALPGIVSAMMLAISRAIGETMIVVMAAGLAANLTANPFESVTTVTVQIVTLLVGDQEFDSAKTLAAFALGLVLFCVTLLLNVIALQVIRKYQEQYD
ncbi:phosphate ABC transporter permease subunit PstC [Devosia sp.]|uniref:phosphate ABC transporter permease subunit PstC n=1 Tax=Devosia sp. TaxID=1871048 RepID=UPI003F710D1A